MKPNLKYTALFVSALVLFLTACKKSDNTKGGQQNTTAPTDIYIAGNSGDTALCWVNGRTTYLNDGSLPAYANSITVNDNNIIYVAGQQYFSFNSSSQLMAASWENGLITFLTTAQQVSTASANTVFCSGNDVYVGGTEYDDKNVPYPTYWKNGTANVIGLKFAQGTSVFTVGSDVYLGGGYPKDTTKASQLTPCYWKDATKVDLVSDGTIGNVLSVFVSGTDVYSAGYADLADGQHAVYWKNTTMTKLANAPAGSVATSIYVLNGAVYVTGYQSAGGVNVATYWKNNVPVALSTNNSNALSVFPFGNDVYVCGYETNSSGINVATYWKNGVATHIDSKGSIASSIFVKTRVSQL